MRARASALPALFVAASFGAAFLIFLVQPLVGKRILPWFGGAPSVWMLCLAFYQTTLFAGYAYAHALMRLARPKGQLLVHALALAIAVAALPVIPGPAWRPEGGDAWPIARVLLLLAASVGPAFLVLAATGPLLQAWYARSLPERSPYPLYAVSNLGSLLGVAAYPFVLEPRLGVVATSGLFSIGFALTAALVFACAWLAWRLAPDAPPTGAESRDRIPAADAALWLVLSGSAVILLMGVTNELCRDIASVPFLWMLPLGIYLSTLVICFGFERAYRRAFFVVLAAAAWLAPMATALAGGAGAARWSELTATALGWQTTRWGLLLFGLCMLLHGELYRLRPPAASLTRFYLYVAGGGALGGLFVGIAAPRLFDDYHELRLGLALGGLAVLAALCRSDRGWLRRGAPPWRRVAAAVAVLAAIGTMVRTSLFHEPGLLHKERSFFGVLRVTESPFREGDGEEGPVRRLVHGTTGHGEQWIDRKREPTSYYGIHTGIGLAFGGREEGTPWHVGVVGLGAGTLAAYGREGDVFRFYEIDPAIVDLAGRYFAYLEDSAARIEVVEGDARLSLEAERRAEARRFDLLVLDAYSSDSVPVHLMTREAMELFAERVAGDGQLAFHVSNRYFEFSPLVARLGAEVGMESLMLTSPLRRKLRLRPSKWVVLCRDGEVLRDLERRAAHRWRAAGARRRQYVIWRPDEPTLAGAPLWTDDYSDLLGILADPRRPLR